MKKLKYRPILFACLKWSLVVAMASVQLRIGEFFPQVMLPTISGAEINISEPDQPALWQLVIFYSGFHSEYCTSFLNKLEQSQQQLISNGIGLVAVSADSGEQLQSHLTSLEVSFPIAYGLSVTQMRELTLYISLPQHLDQTNHPFCEPGLFVINEHGQIILLDIANHAMFRPGITELVDGLIELKNREGPLVISGSF